MPSQPSSRLCHVWSAVYCRRVSLGPHTVHYVHCRLDLSDWKPCLVTTHVCRQYAGSCRPPSVNALSSKISECVGVVTSRMESNRLWLNCDKTEVVWCATSRRQHQLPRSALSVDGTLVKPVMSAGDLGIYIDADLVMRTQRKVSRRFAVLQQLRQIRHSVPTDTFQTPVVSLVLTRLDYGNSVLANLPVYFVRRLQSVPNAVARSDHISDALACLHWLRGPTELFRIAVPQTWNELPEDVTSAESLPP